MAGQADPPLRRATAAAVVAATLAGFGCMAAELTAVRLLAPHFGDSAYVWTNVIGVILAALAAGAWLGGRLAGKADPATWAARCLLAAGLLVASAPWVAGGLGAWLVPAELPLDAAMPVLVRASFVATVLLFAPAMACLGAVSPLLVTSAVRGGGDVGRSVGAISAAGTIGSLLGTFLATHWLVPTWGCRLTLAGAGGLLALAALPLLARPRAAVAVVALALAASGLFATAPLRPAAPGRELLAERESRVQFLQVLRERTGELQRTLLVINEGLDSFHSLAIAGSTFSGDAYYDYHALAPLLAGDGVRPAGLRALSIGDAAGTLRAVYAGVHPGAVVDAVDIDGAAMELGDEFFPGPKAPGRRCVVDGRVFVTAASDRWHVIHVDAYAHQVYVPAHLASRQFFAAVRDRLHPGGVVACNVGALHEGDPVLRAIGTTMAAEFGHAHALFLPASRNVLLVARAGDPVRPERLAEFAFGGEALGATDAEHWRAVVAFGSRPGAWCEIADGELLDDDRPVLDQLLAASYVADHDPDELLGCGGSTATAGAEAAAWGAYERRDWAAVLRAVQDSAAPSALLRELAGHARWSRRELRSADREYAAAVELARDPEHRRRLEQQRQRLAAELAPLRLARATANEAGWWQFVSVVAALAGLWALRRLTA